jgi:endonuclease-3
MREVPELLQELEKVYGVQTAAWPDKPYDLLIWMNCGYPASDANCMRGWAAVQSAIGTKPKQILAAPRDKLAQALKAGGIVPELRAVRLAEIATRVETEFPKGFEKTLAGDPAEARKILKKFPTIGDPGADRILLFTRIAAVAAVPSNHPQVLVRIRSGKEVENYTVNYRAAQKAIDKSIPVDFEQRMRAYLLLKAHGEALCKRTNPKCEKCPLRSDCKYQSIMSARG